MSKQFKVVNVHTGNARPEVADNVTAELVGALNDGWEIISAVNTTAFVQYVMSKEIK